MKEFPISAMHQTPLRLHSPWDESCTDNNKKHLTDVWLIFSACKSLLSGSFRAQRYLYYFATQMCLHH